MTRLPQLTESYLDELRAEFPGLGLIDKSQDRLSGIIDRALRILTFGGQSSYCTNFVTVLGNRIYLPEAFYGWSAIDQVVILRHERVHLLQRRRWGLPLMAFFYLVPWFPLGLAYGRARIEWEAYEETLRATWQLKGPRAAQDPRLRRHVIERFVGSDYGWMWPFPRAVNRWYDLALAKIESEIVSAPQTKKP